MAEHLDVEILTTAVTQSFYTDKGVGQSFQVGQAGTLTHIALNIGAALSSGTMAIRVGTSDDLSSTYLAQSDSPTISTSGWASFTFTAGPDLSLSTTYYFVARMMSGTNGDLKGYKSSSSAYANGNLGQGDTGYPWAMWNAEGAADLACRIYIDSDAGGGPETTGEKFPTAGSSVSESPWSDDAWVNPTNIYSDNATNASVTASTYDAGDQTEVLKAQGFDFSEIPDNSTINGVICRVNAYYGTAAVSIDLLQLLNTSGAKVGTNQCSTPEALGTDSAGIVTKGSSSDLWGNELDSAWVKDTDFGVAIGCLAGGSGNSNNDVYVDYVTLEIYYTPPEAGGDAMPMAMNQFRHLRS